MGVVSDNPPGHIFMCDRIASRLSVSSNDSLGSILDGWTYEAPIYPTTTTSLGIVDTQTGYTGKPVRVCPKGYPISAIQ
jgi:hypothetical protein